MKVVGYLTRIVNTTTKPEAPMKITRSDEKINVSHIEATSELFSLTCAIKNGEIEEITIEMNRGTWGMIALRGLTVRGIDDLRELGELIDRSIKAIDEG